MEVERAVRERILVRRFQNAKTRGYRDKAYIAMLNLHMGLLHHRVRAHVDSSSALYEDCLQEARLAVLRAMEKFNLARENAQFMPYMARCVDNAVRRAVLKERGIPERVFSKNATTALGRHKDTAPRTSPALEAWRAAVNIKIVDLDAVSELAGDHGVNVEDSMIGRFFAALEARIRDGDTPRTLRVYACEDIVQACYSLYEKDRSLLAHIRDEKYRRGLLRVARRVMLEAYNGFPEFEIP